MSVSTMEKEIFQLAKQPNTRQLGLFLRILRSIVGKGAKA